MGRRRSGRDKESQARPGRPWRSWCAVWIFPACEGQPLHSCQAELAHFSLIKKELCLFFMISAFVLCLFATLFGSVNWSEINKTSIVCNLYVSIYKCIVMNFSSIVSRYKVGKSLEQSGECWSTKQWLLGVSETIRTSCPWKGAVFIWCLCHSPSLWYST